MDFEPFSCTKARFGHCFSTRKGKMDAFSSQKHQDFFDRSPESISKMCASLLAESDRNSYNSCKPAAPAPIIARSNVVFNFKRGLNIIVAMW